MGLLSGGCTARDATFDWSLPTLRGGYPSLNWRVQGAPVRTLGCSGHDSKQIPLIRGEAMKIKRRDVIRAEFAGGSRPSLQVFILYSIFKSGRVQEKSTLQQSC